ncbi:MAG: glutamine-synthetase adenylyltransferase, partial [Rhodobacteraceae bacterium]|nr:glutamine-synthetase adenylyltransferase [Paracoccaceae bacterium]
MNFTDRLVRCPIPFDPDAAAEARALVPGLPDAVRDVVAGAAGGSPFLRAAIAREAEWLTGALQAPPEAARADVLTLPDGLAPAELGAALRRARRRLALLAALCDLGGVWSLEEVTGALTALADLAVSRAVAVLVGDEIRRGRIPGAQPDDAATGAGMVVLAMGKMGAGELNYSSDIDLICLFDDARFDDDDVHEARAAFVRVTRKMCALLSDLTSEGYVFRTDLRLRPDAAVTPVCLSMED